MSLKQKILKDASIYLFAIIISKIIQTVQGLVVAKLLGPILYGVRNTFSLLLNYSKYSNLALPNAMQVKSLQLKEENKKTKIDNVSFSYTILSAVLLSILFILLVLFSSFSDSTIIIILLLILALIFNQIYTYLLAILNRDKAYNKVSMVTIVFAALSLVLTVALVYFYAVPGFFLALAITNLVVSVYLLLTYEFNLKLDFDFIIIKDLLKFSMPFLLVIFTQGIMITVDQLAVLMFFTKSQLGFYGLAFFFVSFLYIFFNSVQNVLLPHIYKYASKELDLYSSRQLFMKPLLVVAYSLPIVLVGIYLFIDPVIILILPSFASSTFIIKLLLFVVFFRALSYLPFTILSAQHKLRKILIYQLLSLLLFALGFYYIYINNISYEYIAISALLMFVVYYILTFKDAFSFLKKQQKVFFFELLVPFIVNFSVLFFFQYYVFIQSSIQSNIILFALLLIINIPFFIRLNNKTKLLEEVRKIIKL